MNKLKRLPNTKNKPKFVGPHTVCKVTESHITIYENISGAKKNKNIPIHLVRLYTERKPNSLKQADPMEIDHISSKVYKFIV